VTRLPGEGRAGARPYLALAVGMAAVSSSALIITFARAEGVPSLSIAALRMAFAAAALAPFALTRARAELRRLPLRDIGLAAASGLLLALHFASWISSLDYISVMSSVALVSMNPLFVGLASLLFLRERVGGWTAAGVAVAVAGAAVVALSDRGAAWAGHATLRGDLLALLGAAAASGYLLIGRGLRRRLSLVAYVTIAYTTAAAALLVAALALRAPLAGWSARGWALVLLLALVPQLVGHTAYNYALKHVSAVFLTVTLLAEPIGAALLAIPLLGQVPPPLRAAGGALILAGIWIASRAETRPGRKVSGSV
jgi:drug/metabolite transporter (DMT)-like permease